MAPTANKRLSFWILLRCAAIAYLMFCAGIFLFQRSLIYAPTPRSIRGRASVMTLSTEAGPLLVTTRPADGPKALLYLGGNAEDVSVGTPTLSTAFPEHAIYRLHYRGYGGSAGSPSEKALFTDALLLFDTLHRRHTEVVVMGRSLGSGPAVYVASRRPVRRLILVTPFNSLQDVAVDQFPFLPVRWLLLDKFESWRYAPQVTAPTLILVAENDEIVPRESIERLHAAFRPGVATLKSIASAGHNSISETAQYTALLKETH